jgi:phospholipid transport system substrate-binding protein
MKKLVYSMVSLLIIIQIVFAGDKFDAEELVKNKIDAVFMLLQKKGLDPEVKKSAIAETLTPMFDFQLMAKLTLGRKYWPHLSEEKKNQFTDLFIDRMRSSYLDKLALYTDEEVIFEPLVQVEEKVHVPTLLISKKRKTSILYKLHKSAEGWKVYDFEIEGISIIRSFRSQFDQILENGTIDDLLLKMEKPDDK